MFFLQKRDNTDTHLYHFLFTPVFVTDLPYFPYSHPLPIAHSRNSSACIQYRLTFCRSISGSGELFVVNFDMQYCSESQIEIWTHPSINYWINDSIEKENNVK